MSSDVFSGPVFDLLIMSQSPQYLVRYAGQTIAPSCGEYAEIKYATLPVSVPASRGQQPLRCRG